MSDSYVKHSVCHLTQHKVFVKARLLWYFMNSGYWQILQNAECRCIGTPKKSKPSGFESVKISVGTIALEKSLHDS